MSLRRRALSISRRLLSPASDAAALGRLSLLTFGAGASGVLGLSNEKNTPVPRVVSNEAFSAALASSSSTSISAGLFHTAVVCNDSLWTFGRGAGGRLGHGDDSDAPFPQRVSLTEGFAQPLAVAAGGLHTLLLLRDGRLLSTGYGGFGALGSGTYKPRSSFELVNSLPPLQAVAAGGAHSLGIARDGRLYSWGRDEGEGRFGNSPQDEGGSPAPSHAPLPAGVGEATHIAAGGFHSLVAARIVSHPQQGGDENYRAGDAGDDASCVVLSCGGNANGECGRSGGTFILGIIPELSGRRVTQLAAGGFHSAALLSSGDVLCWGAGVACGVGHARPLRSPTAVPGLPPVSRVACGGATTFAVGVDGSLWGWGKSATKLGTTSADVLLPSRVELPPWCHAIDVAVGAGHAVVLARVTSER